MSTQTFTYDPNLGMMPAVFISCASKEFKQHRELLTEKFRGHDAMIIPPIAQEEFRRGGRTLLKKLHDQIRQSALVVHLVGKSVGWHERPDCETVNEVLEEITTWLKRPLPKPVPEFENLSYTQWEAVLAFYYDKELFVYLSADADLVLEREPTIEHGDDDQNELASQQRHLSWLLKRDKDVGPPRSFKDATSLWEAVLPDVTQCLEKAKLLHQARLHEASVSNFLREFVPTSPKEETLRELAGRRLLGSHFYGRDWLHKDVANWLEHGQERVYWLQADAGFGKSRFCAALAQGWKSTDHVKVDAIVYLDPAVGPVEVLTKICAQLRSSCVEYQQGFGEAWESVDWNSIVIPQDLDAAGEEQERFIEQLIEPLLLRPLRKQQPQINQHRNSLIMIDGLDELMQWRDEKESHPLASMIARLLAERLPNFSVLLTSRPATIYPLLCNLIDTKQPRKPDLRLRRRELQSDAEALIRGELSAEWHSPEVIAKLQQKSKSSMLYLHYLIYEIRDRDLKPQDIDNLPHGMANYYLHKLDQYFAGDDYRKVFERTVRPCLEVIAAGERTDLAVADVETCCEQQNVQTLRHSMRSMIVERNASRGNSQGASDKQGRLIVERPKTIEGQLTSVFAPFHLSFFDWLLGRQFDEGDDGDQDDGVERDSRASHKFRVHAQNGERQLAQWTMREFEKACQHKIAPDPREYWVRQGIDHVLRTFMHLHLNELAPAPEKPLEKFTYLVQSVEFLGWLKQFPKIPGAQSVVARTLPMLSTALALSTQPESDLTSDILQQMEPVDQFALFELVKDICSTDITDDVVWWIGRTQLDERDWHKLVQEMLKLEWVVRFAAGSGQAARYRRLMTDPGLTNRDRELAVTEIDKLLNSMDVNRQEMGCYAIGEIAKHKDELDKRVTPQMEAWLKQVSKIDLYFAQSVLGDILIDLTLRGSHQRVAELDSLGVIPAFWTPIWQYTRQDVIRVLSQRTFQGQTLARNLDEFQVEVDRETDALRVRQQRIICFANSAGEKGPALAALLQKSELDDDDDEVILSWLTRDVDSVNERIQTAAELLRLLFTHTAWRVSEKGSSVLAELQARTHDSHTCLLILDHLIDTLPSLPSESWRVIYGTAEACYLSRHFDNGREFYPCRTTTRLDHCLRTYYGHPNCDVRGLLVENVAFLVEQPDQGQCTHHVGRKTEYPKDYSIEIDHWLVDSDIWVLEHVYQMFLAIKEKQGFDMTLGVWLEKRMAWVESNPDCLLALVSKTTNAPWMELERGDFLRQLQLVRRQQMGRYAT